MEDFLLHIFLQDVEIGFYVDVGANDPWHLSVTKNFYDRGWSGINIEPLEDKFLDLCQDRPRDINLNLGAGNVEEEKMFNIAGMSTSCDMDTIKEMQRPKKGRIFSLRHIRKLIVGKLCKKHEQHVQKILVRRLSDIFLDNLRENQIIHFCKIDVEGFERSVLEGMDFRKFRPWIMVVEATFPETKIPTHDRWEYILSDNHYGLIASWGINRYYGDQKNETVFQRMKGYFENLDWAEYDFFKVKMQQVGRN
jgi:FkbM family methyltransferase